MDHILVAGFLISHQLLNGSFVGSLNKDVHQKKVGVFLGSLILFRACLWCLGSLQRQPCQREFLEALPSYLNHVGWGTFSLKVLAGPAQTSSDTEEPQPLEINKSFWEKRRI